MWRRALLALRDWRAIAARGAEDAAVVLELTRRRLLPQAFEMWREAAHTAARNRFLQAVGEHVSLSHNLRIVALHWRAWREETARRLWQQRQLIAFWTGRTRMPPPVGDVSVAAADVAAAANDAVVDADASGRHRRRLGAAAAAAVRDDSDDDEDGDGDFSLQNFGAPSAQSHEGGGENDASTTHISSVSQQLHRGARALALVPPGGRYFESLPKRVFRAWATYAHTRSVGWLRCPLL